MWKCFYLLSNAALAVFLQRSCWERSQMNKYSDPKKKSLPKDVQNLATDLNFKSISNFLWNCFNSDNVHC